ncbi:MAG: hypothetical protein PT944_06435 [Actinomycetaceae bacterium]|nr:hypothetical protein [Actinomycetaceae bacterium]MDY5273006.1 hypothetical protein [Arcanobacterium sp.]
MDVITLATIPAVLALVNLAKKFGVRGKWATLAAVLIGISVQFLDAAATYAWQSYGLDWHYLARILSQGLILGLSAAGLYDLAPTTTSSNAGMMKGRHSYDAPANNTLS